MLEPSHKKRKISDVPATEPSAETGPLEFAQDPEVLSTEINETEHRLQPKDRLQAKEPKRNIGMPLIAGFIAGLSGAAVGFVALYTVPQLRHVFNSPDQSLRLNALEAAQQNYANSFLEKNVSLEKNLNEKIAALESRVAGLNTKITTDMPARLDRLDGLSTLVSKNQSGQDSTALLVATDALRRKFEAGASFSNELKAVETWIDPNFNISPLKLYAESGLKDMRSIATRFDGMRKNLIADTAPPSISLFDSVGQAASSLIKVRPVNEPAGRDPASLVAYIYSSILQNHAGSALDDLVKLPEPALSRVQPIIADLKARVDVEASIRALEQNALQRLSVKPR